MARQPSQQLKGPYHLMNFIIKGTPPCEHFQMVSQTLCLTQPIFFKPQVTNVISFFFQIWQVRYPMGRGQQGESIKTTFIFWRAFVWSSANMAERHFWQIDIFFLKDFLVMLMIWLDAPYNTLDIHTLRIFLSSSYDLWREFP